jgi:hypothetical protein
MADRFWNVALGGDLAENVVEGASDTSLYLAVRVTYDATGASREQAIKALDAVKYYLLQDSWPPV